MKSRSILSRTVKAILQAAAFAIFAALGTWMFFSSASSVVNAGAIAVAHAIPQANGAPRGKAETYYLLVFSNATAGQEDEFNRWYDHQHAQDVVSVPGFMTAQRFVLSDKQLRESKPLPKYLIVYKVVTDDLVSVYAEVNRRLETGITVLSPAFDRPSSVGYTYKPIRPVIYHKGSQEEGSAGANKNKMQIYYQLVFSDPTTGQEEEYNKWYDTQHAPDVVSTPNFVSAQRLGLSKTQLNEKPPIAKYLVMFRIETDDLPSTFAEFKKLAPKMPMSPAFGQNFGYTYKAIGPVIYGDKVRAERAAKKAGK